MPMFGFLKDLFPGQQPNLAPMTPQTSGIQRAPPPNMAGMQPPQAPAPQMDFTPGAQPMTATQGAPQMAAPPDTSGLTPTQAPQGPQGLLGGLRSHLQFGGQNFRNAGQAMGAGPMGQAPQQALAPIQNIQMPSFGPRTDPRQYL